MQLDEIGAVAAHVVRRADCHDHVAARQELPAELYALARLEGASPWYVLRTVTLPLMAPVLLLLAVRDVAVTLQASFTATYLLTDGGPDRATLFLPIYVYDVGFEQLRYGYGAAMTLAMFAALLLLVGALAFSGIGLLVAARPQTIEGVSGLMNLVMLPMWLLSGTFFSAERFPAMLQPFIKTLPLTALNDGLRAVMNDGAPLAAGWLDLSILLAWCLISFLLALRLFRWQ